MENRNDVKNEILEKVTSTGIQLRTSARVSKKLKLDQEAALAAAKKEEVKEDPPPAPVVEEKPRVRRLIWSPDDKLAFFEALNEHGKNFDEIEKYMAARAKRRSDPGSNKNRERARHFYYRTWHKISKYVNLPDCIKKSTQELYALINFGELRKKVGHVTERNAQKLNELIYSGCTQVRVGGRASRIKTPVCRALRKLNVFEDDGEDLKLPSRVNILITARSNRDSARVQSIAHNTRVKTTLSIDSSIQNITTFLTRRWAGAHGHDVLRVGPKKDAIPTHANFKCGPVMTSSSVSLLAHERKIRSEGYEKVQELLRQLQIGKTKATLKYQREGTAAVNDDSDINSEVVDPKSLAPPQNGSENPTSTENHDMRNRIGQLYLMYGKQGALELEYWWEEAEKETVVELSDTLTRLLSIAKLFHTKTRVECPCGHVCKGSIKVASNAQAKAQKQLKAATKKLECLQKLENTSSTATLTKSINNNVSDTSSFKLPLPPNSSVRSIQPLVVERPTTSPASNAAVAALKMLENSRYCQRPGRQRRSRSVVVQRMLPVLPKLAPSVASAVVSLNGIKVVQSPVLQQFSGANAVTVGNLSVTKVLPVILPKSEPGDPTSSIQPATSGSPPVLPEQHVQEGPCTMEGILRNNPQVSLPLSSSVEPSETDLLESFKSDLENAPTLDGHTTTLDGIISTLPGAEKWDPSRTTVNSFKGILSQSSGPSEGDPPGGMLEVTPPTSPTRILKEGESQWLNADVNDFSLSSFLGHLESPLKTNGASEDTHLPSDIDSHFQALMTESSFDFTDKFADLAAKIVGPSQSSVPP